MTGFIAYLDPGSGSLLFQIAISSLLGFLLFMKQLRTMLKDLLRRFWLNLKSKK